MNALPSTVHPPDAALAFVSRVVGSRREILCVWNRHDGCWGLPGGRREPEDVSLLQTVLRELKEETGLVGVEQAPRMGPLPIYDAEPVDADRVRRVFIFAVVVAKDAAPRALEKGAPVAWFTHAEFMARTKFVPFYKAFFSRLADTNPVWFQEVFGSGPKIEKVLREDLEKLRSVNESRLTGLASQAEAYELGRSDEAYARITMSMREASGNRALAESLRSTHDVPVPSSRPTFVRWLVVEGRPEEFLVESLAEGFFCRVLSCRAWNGDLKGARTTCRCCDAPRPRRPQRTELY